MRLVACACLCFFTYFISCDHEQRPRYVTRIVEELQTALNADYVVLGGGNVKKMKTLPPKTRLGANGNAFIGGFRLWSAKQSMGIRIFAE